MAPLSRPKHDVFLCFRGNDVRGGFASHLYAALRRRRIKTFVDSDLEKGVDPMSQDLQTMIARAKLSVAILSPNFGASIWCLNFLVQMLECRRRTGHVVIPVLYNVDSIDVTNQTGSFAAAFEKHEQHFGVEMVQKWRAALRETTDLSGWNSFLFREEAMLVDGIAQDIEMRLKTPRTKAALEWTFLIANFILEIPSAVFDQLSSEQKPQYALAGMLISFVAVILCVVELVYKGRAQRVRWRCSWPLPWFYCSAPSTRRFGSFTDIVGLLCAFCQCVVTPINYYSIHRGADNPIQFSVWPIIFAFGLLCSKFMG